MSVRVTTYRNGTSGDPVNRRDDIAAKALAATTNCDAVRVYEEEAGTLLRPKPG